VPLEHLARVGRRTAKTSMSPGGLRPCHLIALKLLSGRGPASQQGAGGRAEPGSEQRRRTAHELEERELITRRRDPADRRRHIVELSPSGEDELALAYAQLRQVEDDLLSALSAEERATLYDLLIRAVGAKSPPCDAADESPASPA